MLAPDEYYPTDSRLIWYQPAQFTRRLDDELYRLRRYDVPLSLLFLSFPLTSSRRVAREVNEFVTRGLRRLDFAGMLGDGDYAIALSHTDREGAQTVVARLREKLSAFPGRIGSATADDRMSPPELLEAARQDAKASVGVAA